MLLILVAITVIVLITYLMVLKKNKIPPVNNYFSYGSIAFVFAGILLVMSQKSVHTYFQKVAKWPKIEAKIIGKKITGNRAVLPEITYRYTFNGKIYKGKSNLGIPPFGSRNKRTLTAQTVLKDEPIGGGVLIACNPENPSVSTTQFHPPWNFYGKISFGSFLYASGLLILLFRLTTKRNKISLPVV